MQSATCQGASYRLYVPSNWTPNVNSGISGAFFAQGEYSMVTVTDYICEDESETPEVRKAAAEAAYASLYPTYEKLSESDVKLGKEDAKAFVFKFKIEHFPYPP